MAYSPQIEESSRYSSTTKEKARGETYTPKILSDFVASNIVHLFDRFPVDRPLRVLDPAIGHGELLVSLLEQISFRRSDLPIEVFGFEPNREALGVAESRIRGLLPSASVQFESGDFLEYVLETFGADSDDLFSWQNDSQPYDLVIANPPYVRTQIMGATKAQNLAGCFGLSGRVDLYYAFILAIAQVLKPRGVAGIIVSNRFMTTRSGSAVRYALLQRYNLRHVWDLGDTKLFDAAVLPAVLLVEGKNGHDSRTPQFSSIYQTTQSASLQAGNPVEALSKEGIVEINDGRRFRVQHGTLDAGGALGDTWRIRTEAVDDWLATVGAHRWGTFRDIGKIRVGVKTCADKVFIRNNWHDIPDRTRPELLKPLTTHHIANRFKAIASDDQPTLILYPHEVVAGRRRVVDISNYPNTRAYLEKHRPALEKRKYVIEAGREWYEIWVPQDPGAWKLPKLVFRDIAAEPTFWIDLDGSVVNGDCYWLICHDSTHTDLLWLAVAVGNSTFIEQFYDHRFNNKLYAGRRRFITQYVEKFPLPDPYCDLGKAIIAKAKRIHDCIPAMETEGIQRELDGMVWKAFGLAVKEISR